MNHTDEAEKETYFISQTSPPNEFCAKAGKVMSRVDSKGLTGAGMGAAKLTDSVTFWEHCRNVQVDSMSVGLYFPDSEKMCYPKGQN